MSSISTGVVAVPGRAQPYTTGEVRDFMGGLNDAVSDELIADNEMPLCENYIPDRSSPGMLRKRPGLTANTTTAERVTSFFEGQHTNYYTTQTAVFDLDGTSLLTGLTSSNTYYWARFGAYDIFTNGTEIKKTANGTTFTDVANIPAGTKFITSYHQFLFAFGHDNAKVRWSATGDAETWDADNEWDLDPRVRTPTGMETFNQYVVVFFEDAYYLLSGFIEKQITISHDNQQVGCVSGKSIVKCPIGLFWWSDSGLMFSPDAFRVRNIREKIPNLLEDRSKQLDNEVHAVWHPDEESVILWYASSGSATINRILWYYPKLEAWFTGIGTAAEMGASGLIEAADGSNRIYIGNIGASGKTYYLDGNTDDSANISAKLQTKRFIPVHTMATKNLQQFTPHIYNVGNGTVDVSLFLDEAQAATYTWSFSIASGTGFLLDTDSLDTGVLGSSQVLGSYEIFVGEDYRKCLFEVSESVPERTRFSGFTHEGYVLNA